MSQQRLTIGALAKATATNIETVRYYERIGLLPRAVRTGGNYRTYSPRDIARLGFVRRARDLGFSIAMVRALLRFADEKHGDCEAVGAIASAHLADVERKISDLMALRSELRRLLAQCRRGSVADCRIIEALSPA
jgi:DNA-binding transcriptional MerR regulator